MNTSVVFFTNNLGMGGAEKVFINDANALAEAGLDVRMVLLYGGPEKSPWMSRLRLSPEQVTFLNATNIYDARAYSKLRALLKSLAAPVLFSTLHDATFVARLVALSLPGLRLVTREANTVEKKTWRHKFADALTNGRTNVMLAVSEEVKASLVSYQPHHANRIKILYNGVDVPNKAIRIPHEGISILTVGSLTPKKAHSVLLDAFAPLAKQHSVIRLRVIGAGALHNDLEKQAQELGIKERVAFLGNLPFSKVQEEYRATDIFVLPSDQEGCPNVLLEAMSFGIPSVATNVGAVSEIMKDGESGLIVPRRDPARLAEAITKLLDSPMLREQLGNAARDRIATAFTQTKHLSELKDVLEV